MQKSPDNERLKALRIAIAEVITKTVDGHLTTPEMAVVAMIQVAAAGIIVLEGDIVDNIGWAMRTLLGTVKVNSPHPIDFDLECVVTKDGVQH